MSTTNPYWDDPRITAYVMNELSTTETAEFEAEMQQQPLLAKAVDEARRVTEQLSGFYAAMPAPMLDADRRDEITGAAAPAVKPRVGGASTGLRIALWAVAASILMLAVAIPMWQMQTVQTASTSVSDETPSLELETAQSSNELITDAEVTRGPQPTEFRSMESASVVETASVDVAEQEKMAVMESGMRTSGGAEPAAATRSLKTAPGVVPPSAPFAAESARGAIAKKEVDLPALGAAVKERPVRRSRVMGMDEYGMDAEAMEEMSMDADMDGAMMGVGGEATRLQTLGRNADSIDLAMPMPMETRLTDQGTGPGSPGDKFSPIDENEFRRVSEHPLSTFSIDVDTASYAKVRSYLQSNQLPRPDAVRIEEMVNYFDYDYSGPTAIDRESRDPFAAAMTATICPWNPEHRLVRVGLQAKSLTEQERPQCNLVFLIDTSGSMSQPNKLPLVIEGLKVLLDELRDDDRVAIVVYAGSAGLVLDSTPVEERQRILRSLTQLQAGGSTNGGAGLQLAYATAREHLLKGGVNRVILCSDGDFNVGMTGTDALVREARTQAKSGIDLTVLGFGMGNHNDAMMEKISNDAEGNYAFVDTIAEARKVLVDQLAGTLVTVAKDVKIQIEFNPAVVSSYRLIGYENRLLAKEDFNDDTKDAGEIGAGHQVTALYEIVPAGVEVDAVAPPVDPLKYQPNASMESEKEPATEESAQDKPLSDEVLTLKLRYKAPQGETSKLMTRVLTDSQTPFDQADADFRFATSVAAFGMLLRNSPFVGSWTYENVERAAENSMGSDPHGLRTEFVGLVKTAENLIVRE